MGYISQLALVIVATNLLVTINAGNHTIAKGGVGLQLILSKNGAEYHADHKIRLNFTEASEHCKKAGMELASVQTKDLCSSLMKVLVKANNNAYWTSAKLSGLPSMFVWGDGGNQLDASEIPSWDIRWFKPNNCVMLFNNQRRKEYPPGMYVVACSYRRPVLCQKNSKK